MEAWQILLLIISIYVVSMTLYSVVIYVFINKTVNKRADKNPLLTYFTEKDYPGLNTKELSFKNNQGLTLNGKVYFRNDESDTIVLFFHGFGSGHMAYTTLINDLVTSFHMPVLAFDYTGCDLSEGKKIPNTLQALLDAVYFVKYLKTIPEYQHKKLVLVGHSWGGFVAANLAPLVKNSKITKVISLNGVTDFPLLYKYSSKGPAILIVVIKLLNAFKYKRISFMNTRKSIKNTTIPHLFLHGNKDDAVPFNPFISSLILPNKNNPLIRFHEEKDKYHNVYLTTQSEKALRLLQQDLKTLSNDKNNEVLSQSIKNRDYTKLVENDDVILTIMVNFIKESNL